MKPFDLNDLKSKTPYEFWQDRYAESRNRQRGKAGKLLQQMLSGLPPGRALELGCSNGDDGLWLAEQGWQVTGVDLSLHAVETARRLAQESGLTHRTVFIAMDLSHQFPEGEFELVCALYFQSPYDFPRADILRTAASRVISNGHLLIVSHASGPPWSQLHESNHVFPTLESEWADLNLVAEDWKIIERSLKTRQIKGPEGQEAEVQDNLILLQRR